MSASSTAEIEAAPGRGGAPGTPFRPDIQGLRAVAVLLVVLYHARLPGLPGGYVGVDVFFVVSGYLITHQLARHLGRRGRIDLGDFYARRARRILPASLVVLLITTLAALVTLPPIRVPELLRSVVATALYVPNVLLARQGTNYLAEPAPSPVQHYWSLGVEEQFYLLWPAALLVAWWLGRRSLRRAALITAILTVTSFGLCVVATTRWPSWAFFSLPTRAWELGVGAVVALVAVARAPSTGTPARGPRWAAWTQPVGLVLVLASAVVLDDFTAFPGAVAAVPVAGAALVVASTSVGPTARLLAWRPAQVLGRWSYSLYLWHWPLLVLVEARLGRRVPLWASLALAVVATALAAATFRYVEEPPRHWPALTGRRPRVTGLAALASSVAVVLVAVGSAGLVTRVPLHGPDVAGPPSLAVAPRTPTSVPRDLTPALRSVDAAVPVAFDDGCMAGRGVSEVRVCTYGDPNADRVVALVGDSHAAQWMPGLDVAARERGYRLELVAKTGCPPVRAHLRGQSVADCYAWHDAVVRYLVRSAPDIVVLTGFLGRPGELRTTVDQWHRGYAAFAKDLDSIPRRYVLASTPTFAYAPAACASAHLDELRRCDVDRASAADPAVNRAERSAADEAGAGFVDATSYLCGSTACGPVLGDVLLYRDEHHLTPQAARYLAPVLEEAVWGGDERASAAASGPRTSP